MWLVCVAPTVWCVLPATAHPPDCARARFCRGVCGLAGRRHANGRNWDTLPSVFDICTPRKDIRDGIVESDLAADLARVVEGNASPEYADPAKFFASTYPTKGIRELLRQVLARLEGINDTAVFWLNTSFGGGKTHALIALLHAAQSPPPDAVSEFVGRTQLPQVREDSRL